MLWLALGRPIGRLVAALRHAAAGGPLALDAGNLVETLKARARDAAGRRDGEE